MFSGFFIDRPKFALVIAIVMTLAGGLAIALLPVSEYPSISPPNIIVSANYPGASAEVVEATVATPVEDAVNGVEDMIYMSSKSANDGSYRLTVTFAVGADADMALVRVQNRVKLAEPSLPGEVTAMGLNISERSPDILKIVSFTSPDGRTPTVSPPVSTITKKSTPIVVPLPQRSNWIPLFATNLNL